MLTEIGALMEFLATGSEFKLELFLRGDEVRRPQKTFPTLRAITISWHS
jgi:hypothetical protein